MFPKDTEQQLFHYICEALSAVVHEKRITALFSLTLNCYMIEIFNCMNKTNDSTG